MLLKLYKQRHGNWKKVTVLLLLPIFIFVTTVTALLATRTEPVEAATSDTLSFQGRLSDASGNLVSDGDYNMQFDLYTVDTGGSSQWTETRLVSGSQGVTVRNGYFSVYLGDVTAFPTSIDWDQELWLGMTVRGTSSCAWGSCTPTDSEMTPRFKLTAVPYAFRAGAVVDSAGNAYTGDDLAHIAPSSVQAVNAAVAALRISQSGTGGLLQLQDSGSNDVFTVANDGDTTIAGSLTLGTSTASGLLTLEDGSSNTISFQPGSSQTGDLTFTLPSNTGVADQCLKTDGAGVLRFEDCPGGATTVVKTADEQVTNSNTLQNDDELTFNVEANEVWTVEFNIQSTSNTTADYRFAVAAPAGSTCYAAVQNTENAQSYAQSSCGASFGNVSAQTATDAFRVFAQIDVGGTAGAVTLQWAQNTPNVVATTVHAGSYLTARVEGTGGGGGGGGGSSSFVQNGNAFGTTAVLGTTDTQGLNIITDNVTRLSFTSAGAATLSNGLTISASGLTVTGGIDNNSGGITEAGAVSGLTTLSGGGAVTLQSGGSADLTLDSSSDVLVLSDATLRRSAAGTTTIDLLDSSANTTLSLTNSDGTRVAGLTVEGDISANAVSGNGSGLTNLNGSNIATGTIPDARLSANVALLDTAQTYTARPTFNSGLVLGNTASATAGAVRWTGTDFEGYDGTQWVSLTSNGSSPLLEGVLAFGKYDGATPSTLDIDGATIAKNGTGDYTVTFDTAASTANYTIQLTVDEPTASLDDVNISADNVSTTSFDVDVHEGDNGTTADVRVDRTWNFIVFDSDAVAGGGSGGGTSFVQNGNAFGAAGVLGTTDNNGLNIVTNGSNALTFTSGGVANFTQDTSVAGDLTANGNLFVGTLPTPDASAQAAFYTGAAANEGLVIQGASGQSANLLEFQDNNGNTLAGFNSSGALVLGDSTISSTATASRAISFPDEAGTVCLSGSDACGFLELATGSAYIDATTNDVLVINKTNATGDLLEFQRTGTPVFTVANSGALQIQATSSTAMDIRNAGGTSYFTVDTSTGNIRIGPATADATGVLFTLDTKNTTGDPAGASDGAMYYNSGDNKFRCRQDGTWIDCIDDTPALRSFVDTTSDSVVDNNTTDYWDTAAENNNSYPIITPSSTTRPVFGIVTVEFTSATTGNRDIIARVERNIGSAPTCGSGTVVGGNIGIFSTNTGLAKSGTITFIDSPATTSDVYYTVCSDSGSNNAGGMTVTDIRVTLEEVENSN